MRTVRRISERLARRIIKEEHVLTEVSEYKCDYVNRIIYRRERKDNAEWEVVYYG